MAFICKPLMKLCVRFEYKIGLPGGFFFFELTIATRHWCAVVSRRSTLNDASGDCPPSLAMFTAKGGDHRQRCVNEMPS